MTHKQRCAHLAQFQRQTDIARYVALAAAFAILVVPILWRVM